MTTEKELPPRHRPATSRRSLWRAIIYGLLALIFAGLTVATFGDAWLFVLFFLPAFIFARLSFRHFKHRYGGTFSQKDLGRNDPVLFLRPFDMDAGWDGAAAFNLYRPGTWRKFVLISPSNLTALYLELTGRASFEQVLAFVTRRTGPLVAIGEPGQPPILGAKNLYVGDDNWQEQVVNLARRSRVVVLTAGVSSGVLWEVGTMVKEVPPDRFLLNIPGRSRRRRRKHYATFFEAAADYFPAGLPGTINGARFLTFGENWQPQEKLGCFHRPSKHTPPWVAKKLNSLLM